MKLITTGGQILAVRTAQAAVIAVTGILVARSLGPTGQGHFSLTVLVIMLGASLLNGGMGLAAVPRLRHGEVTLRRMLQSQALWIALAAGAVVLLGLLGRHTVLVGLARSHLGWDTATVAAAGTAILALLAFEIFFYDLLATGRVVIGPVVNLSRAILHCAAVTVLILWFTLDLNGAVVAYATAQVYAVLVVAVLLWRASSHSTSARTDQSGTEAKARPDGLLTLMVQNLRRGWVGQLSAIASLLHLRLDQAIVSVYWGAAVVGIYSVAVLVGELLWLLSGALSPLLVYSSAAPDHPQERDLLAARAVRVGLVATAAVALPLGALATPLLEFFFGEAYVDSAPALRALLPGVVLFAPAAVLAGDFIGRGHPAWNAQASVLTVVVNITFGLLLIPRFGAVGASWASTIAYTAGALAMIFRFCRTTGLSLLEIMRFQREDFRR